MLAKGCRSLSGFSQGFCVRGGSALKVADIMDHQGAAQQVKPRLQASSTYRGWLEVTLELSLLLSQ